MAATKNANAIPSVQARRRLPAVRHPHAHPGLHRARRQRRRGAVRVQRRLRVRSTSGSATASSSALSYTHSQFESNNDASLGEGGTDALAAAAAELLRLRGGVERVAFDVPHRFVVSYLWEIPGPKSGFLKHVLGGWQLARHHRVPVGPAVHDPDGRRLERRRHDRLRPAEHRRRLRSTWDDDHRTFTNNGCYTRAARHQQPAAGQQPRQRQRAAQRASGRASSGTPTSAC